MTRTTLLTVLALGIAAPLRPQVPVVSGADSTATARAGSAAASAGSAWSAAVADAMATRSAPSFVASVAIDSAFLAWRPARSTLRPTLQVAGVMAVGLGIYIYKGELNAYDWALTGPKVRERFTTLNHFRFDDNEFAMNNVAHPVAGALYYGFARANGYGPLGSFLYSLGGSTFWEVVVELREVASLNDLVATPTSGLALGEAFYQHETFFRRAAPTLANRLLSGFFAGGILLNRAFDEPVPPAASPMTHGGLPADRAHDIRLDVAYGTMAKHGRTDDAWTLDLRARTEIASAPGSPGADVHGSGGGPLTGLELAFGLEDGRLSRFDLGALTVFRGISVGEARRSLLHIGPATAFHIHTADTDQRLLDLQAVASVIGLRGDWVGGAGGLRGRVVAEGYADFSSVRPLALHDYWADQPLPAGKSVLHRNQYYYALGYTGGARLELDWGGLAVTGSLDHHAYESLDGRHRKVEDGPDNLHVSDTRTCLRAALEYDVGGGFLLGAWLTDAAGWGDMDGYVVRREDRSFGTRLSYRF